MTVDYNSLKTKSKEELIDIAKQLNAPFHHSNKPETLISNIINKVSEQVVTHPDQQAQAKKPEEPVFLTEQELEAALAPIKASKPAFSTEYNHEDKCVVLRYNDGRYRHSETMSLSCSLSKFKRKAAEIAKGPLVVRGHRPEDWERLGGSPKNQYTEVVLA